MLEIMISALQHYAYCPRQCALIHLEQVFKENEFTIKGHISHKRVHEEQETKESSTAMTLWSVQYGLIGRSDKVEWVKGAPRPVEHKYGRKNKSVKLPDEVQLCAQAFCLEEMFNIKIKEADIFYVSSHKREKVVVNDTLREKTLKIIDQTRGMLLSKKIPRPVNDARCNNCSLNEICMPSIISSSNTWTDELRKVWNNGTIT